MIRHLQRPEPILRHTARPIDRTTPPGEAAVRLRDGEQLIVTDQYSTGAEVLAQLRALLRPPREDAPYDVRHAFKRSWREASLRLLAPIVGQQLALKDPRPIGLLGELYPGLPRFSLPFVHVQELHGASGRYQEGAHLAVLGHRLHPFYGTYVPTRTTHLELFGTWLHQHEGPRARAIDVGTGCGVLALMLCRAGVARVLATDKNPNAIESVKRELKRLPITPPITPVHADLFGDDTTVVDLIVFNPPWMRGQVEGLLEQALYFDDDVFERFFDAAAARITAEGRIVLLFSNLITLVQPDVPHPIEAELARGRLRLVKKLHRKVKPTRSKSGQRRKTREKVEVWELALA